MKRFDKNRFSFLELITNDNGKKSLSGLAGFMIITTGVLAFICAVIGYFLKFPLTLELLNIVVLYTTVGAGLLGLRKLKKEDKKEEGMDV